MVLLNLCPRGEDMSGFDLVLILGVLQCGSLSPGIEHVCAAWGWPGVKGSPFEPKCPVWSLCRLYIML